MTSVFAIVRRILTQFARDKRTLALLFVAPLVVLWLLSVILGADTVGPKIATVDLPAEFQTQFEQTDARITEANADEASTLLADNAVAAVLSMEGKHTLKVELEGTDSTKSAAVLAACAEALGELRGKAAEEMEAAVADKRAEVEDTIEEASQQREEASQQREEARTALTGVMVSMPAEARSSLAEALGGLFNDDAAEALSAEDFSMNVSNYLPIEDMETVYLHGNEDWRMFDFYGPVFIGIFLFVFTFITSGMSLVTERMGGTMTRFLATPVNAGQILGGYTLAFGLLAYLQSAIILWVALTFIGFPTKAIWDSWYSPASPWLWYR
ncbi:ABC transporter permease [Adlercreutzia rubneri]